MQQIKQQIYSHITSKEVKSYLDENIFNTSFQINEPYSNLNGIKGQGLLKNMSNKSSSMMMSSFMKNNSYVENNMSIKELIKRIQRLIVVNGFWKNVQDIDLMREKIDDLKKENLKMEMKSTERKIKLSRQVQRIASLKLTTFNQTQTTHQNNQPIINEHFRIQDYVNFQDRLRQVQQKLTYEKTKQSLIQIVKLPKQKKHNLLNNTRKQYESMLRHITTIQKVIENIQKLHPDQAALKIQVQELQRQVKQKSIIIEDEQKLNVEITRFKGKIVELQKQHPQLYIQQQKINPSYINKKQQANPLFQPTNYNKQRRQSLQKKIVEFQQFIKEEQSQKHQLLSEIKSFNSTYDQQKRLNEQLFDKINRNFYQYPALIDQVLKINKLERNKIKFLLDRLGLSFQ